MTEIFKKLIKIAGSMAIGGLILMSCESEADNLGAQFFQDGVAGTEAEYDLVAYNVNNNDTIRTDAARLQSATLGAFNEPVFGLQKSSYVSQIRLSQYDPDFGDNPVLDSAVMVIKPIYAADSVTTTTLEDYTHTGDVAAKKVVSTYPVTKYGKTKIGGKTTFNINVHEVTDFLASNDAKIFSNKTVNTGALIGSKVFTGDVNSIKITRDSDNSDLFTRDVSLRIPMDSTFFSNKIIAKEDGVELTDAASFIRYFRGIRVSVEENDGYIFSFGPNDMALTLYYKNDKVENGETTRESHTYTMDLGSSNIRFNQIAYDRSGSQLATALASSNAETGDPKIFMQGMGGPGMGLRIPAETVAAIKDMYANEKIGIVSAKLRFYTDTDLWNNAYKKPDYFTVKQKDLYSYLVDMEAFFGTFYNLVKPYDLDKNPAYYDIGITKTFKEVIEKEATNHDFILNVGNYTYDVNGNLLGSYYDDSQNYNTRSYTPFRAVMVGTDPANERRPKLRIIYGKK